MCLLQIGFLLRDVTKKLVGVATALAEVKDGDGLAEGFDVPAGLGEQLFAQLPVGTGARVHVFEGGVVVIPGEVLRGGFLLDPPEDVGLVLGPVGIDGLVVLRPESGERVPAVVLGTGGMNKIHDGYQCQYE